MNNIAVFSDTSGLPIRRSAAQKDRVSLPVKINLKKRKLFAISFTPYTRKIRGSGQCQGRVSCRPVFFLGGGGRLPPPQKKSVTPPKNFY